MSTNKYIKPFERPREQGLAEDLIVESIKIYGVDLKYMPRTIVKSDALFGEDTLSKFDDAVEVEAYIKNTTGFEGQGDFLSKFNLQIDDQITFTIARKRWDQIRTEKLQDEIGYVLQQEEATSDYANTLSFLLETGTANGYSISSTRPMEGDLIFFPFNNKIYEVTFVEHEAIFYQLGKLFTYDITCELFKYSSEDLATGNTIIDTIESTYSADSFNFQFLMENGDILTDEEEGYIFQEFRVETTNATANNELFTQGSLDFIDFSEQSPFSEQDRW